MSFVRSGGGFLGAHSAADTLYEWPDYGALLGAYFKEHPWTQPGTVLVEDQSHPATAAPRRPLFDPRGVLHVSRQPAACPGASTARCRIGRRQQQFPWRGRRPMEQAACIQRTGTFHRNLARRALPAAAHRRDSLARGSVRANIAGHEEVVRPRGARARYRDCSGHERPGCPGAAVRCRRACRAVDRRTGRHPHSRCRGVDRRRTHRGRGIERADSGRHAGRQSRNGDAAARASSTVTRTSPEAIRGDYYERIFRRSPIDAAVEAHTFYARRTLEAGFTTIRDVGACGVRRRGAPKSDRRWSHCSGRACRWRRYAIGATGGHADLTGFSPLHRVQGVLRVWRMASTKSGKLVRQRGQERRRSHQGHRDRRRCSPKGNCRTFGIHRRRRSMPLVEEAAMWEHKVAAHAHGAEGSSNASAPGSARSSTAR